MSEDTASQSRRTSPLMVIPVHCLVRWFVCGLVGHAVYPCDRNGKSLMTRTDEGVECACHRCGKIIRARFGLALKGLKYQPKP